MNHPLPINNPVPPLNISSINRINIDNNNNYNNNNGVANQPVVANNNNQENVQENSRAGEIHMKILIECFWNLFFMHFLGIFFICKFIYNTHYSLIFFIMFLHDVYDLQLIIPKMLFFIFLYNSKNVIFHFFMKA